MQKGFTMLEIMLVVGIMAFIASLGSVGYSAYSKRARDARRKIDIQEFRSALELYRSNSAEGVYPATSEFGSGATSVLVPLYLKSIIKDPSGANYTYAAEPANCDNAALPCVSYTLSIPLESTSTTYAVSPNSMN